MTYRKLNIPIWLTIIRMVVSPLLLPILLVQFLPANNFLINICLAVIFGLLASTDFFDGFLARRWSQSTMIGRILDPIADKFLVYSTLVGLLAIGKINYYWVVLLIGREFFVMGLRQIALEYGLKVLVSWGGKIKTAVQLSLLIWLILNPFQETGTEHIFWNGMELILLAATLILSLASAADYYRSFMISISQRRHAQ